MAGASITAVTPAWHNAAWMAARIGKSEDWVRRAANDGRLSHHRDGRALRFTEENVQDYLKQTHVPSHMGRSRPRRRTA